MSCHLAKYGCKTKTAKKCTAFTPFNNGKTKRFYAVLNGALQGTGISVCARVCARVSVSWKAIVSWPNPNLLPFPFPL